MFSDFATKCLQALWLPISNADSERYFSSFAVGGDGHVYEGRGWDIVGAHSPSFNNISIGICLIGDYTSELPSTTMLNLTMELVRCATSRGSVQTDYKLLGHRQVRDTQCPGDVLFEEIKKWEHWDPYLNIIPRS
uniref:Uncharacterized protein n=1 Tax=Timema shepardi TaxID=629360 RepID=A0A7R9AL09_TIMSH|nr:unnamed protein product [Timema shepardi]